MQRSGAASRRFRQGQLPVIDRDRKPRESVNCLLPVCIFFCAGLLIGLGQGQEALPAVVEPPPRVVAAPNAASVAAEKAHVHHQHVAAGNFVSEVDDDLGPFHHGHRPVVVEVIEVDGRRDERTLVSFDARRRRNHAHRVNDDATETVLVDERSDDVAKLCCRRNLATCSTIAAVSGCHSSNKNVCAQL